MRDGHLPVAKTLFRIPTLHSGAPVSLPGLRSQLQLPTILDTGRQWANALTFGSLSPTWETQTEFPASPNNL